jgi:hypothetical protein
MAVTNLEEDDINRLINNFSRFVAQQRDRYFPSGVSLSACQKDLFQGFFSPTLLEQVKIQVLHDDERLAHPPDFAMAIVSGYLDLPDVTHMASFTYVDVLVFQQEVAERRLFHGLVHASQFALLGLKQYLELYIRAF